MLESRKFRSSRTGGRDILIVGHDRAETDLPTTTLELAGYRVAGTAGTGAEGTPGSRAAGSAW
ncbi:hypothetical protein ACFZDK_44505 [Streptomyces sp. NPDC007901]|uniref:hypothetical protein n=1 Tax=Streptomyces sp. NPDC007901 TaxID=3364785 RepID=UPI0036EDAB08